MDNGEEFALRNTIKLMLTLFADNWDIVVLTVSQMI